MANILVEDAGHQQGLHVGLGNLQLLRDEGNAHARVRLDQLNQDLGSDIFQKVCKEKGRWV
jgi:hypothetical protein